MISFKLQGLEALKHQLGGLEAVVAAKAMARAARIAFLPVLETAKVLVPVDTGLTRDAIKLQVQRPKGGGGDAVVKVGLRIAAAKGAQKLGDKTASPHWRWHFIELGTRFQPAHPFLRPALDQNAARVVDVFRDELAKGIARALKRQGKGKR